MNELRQRLKSIAAILNPLSILLHQTQESFGRADAQSKIPVLMYHKIMIGRAQYPGINYYVTESTFYEQIKLLHENGYRSLSLDEYLDCLFNRTSWPKKSLLITFDDGYSTVFKLGYPILKMYGFPATVFVSPKYIGTQSFFPGDRQYLGG